MLLVILVCCNKVIFIKIIVCYLFLFIKVRKWIVWLKCYIYIWKSVVRIMCEINLYLMIFVV